MTVESIADFYSETEIGQELRTTAALLRKRFGASPEIPRLAEQLSTWPDTDAAIDAVTSAETFEDLMTSRPHPA